jgi:hypothetical protein
MEVFWYVPNPLIKECFKEESHLGSLKGHVCGLIE